MEELRQFNKSLETKAGQVEQIAREFANVELDIKQKVKHLQSSVPQVLQIIFQLVSILDFKFCLVLNL